MLRWRSVLRRTFHINDNTPTPKQFLMRRNIQQLICDASAGLALFVLACVPFRAWPQDAFPITASGIGDGGKLEMKAFASAYPNRISEVAMRDGDWAMKVDGEWFFWAHGRILTASQRVHWTRYARRWGPFPYSVGRLPPIPHLNPQEAARLEVEARRHSPHRSEDIIDRLFGDGSRGKTGMRLVTVRFLEFHVVVNQRIAKAFRGVAAQCRALRNSDPHVAAFFRHLAHIEGFSNRDVAGTSERSYHSYGLAVDLIPRSFYGKASYWRWLWVRHKSEKWWATPYSQRWMVPRSVVSAFEKHGFVWGGKWLFFDTMHFEYKPEILLMEKEYGTP